VNYHLLDSVRSHSSVPTICIQFVTAEIIPGIGPNRFWFYRFDAGLLGSALQLILPLKTEI